MSLESAADPAIAKIEPIKISYISLKLTCKGVTPEKNIKYLLFFVMKSLCFYRSRKLYIYSKDPAMQSPPHLNLSQAASGHVVQHEGMHSERKEHLCVVCSKARLQSSCRMKPGEHSQRHNIFTMRSILNEVLLNVFVQKPLSVAQIFTPLHSDA